MSLLVVKREYLLDDQQEEIEENEEILSSEQVKMSKLSLGIVITIGSKPTMDKMG